MISRNPKFLHQSSGILYMYALHTKNCNFDKVTIFVPPFAEEMNKSRRMMSLAAEKIATTHNQAAIIFDLFGTGDSEGEFSDATWSVWRQNLIDIIEYVRTQNLEAKISFIALRTGALLINDSLWQLPRHLNSMIHQIHYWNPIFNASQFVNQFLRLKFAGGMMRETGENSSVNIIKQQLIEKGTVEVAGYQLSSNLIEEFEKAKISLPVLDNLQAIHIYEISSLAKITPALTKHINKLCEHYSQIETHLLNGSKFWISQEITICQPLIDLTVSTMGNGDEC